MPEFLEGLLKIDRMSIANRTAPIVIRMIWSVAGNVNDVEESPKCR
jgi:hypothetical protein